LQRTVGVQMTMKRTPRLTFKADPAIAAGSRVEELLRGLHGGQEGQEPHEGEPPADES
jgi:ribosome-binding factor A